MKIEEVRTSFTVYLIASELKSTEGILESLGLAGYMAASFNELTSAFSEFPSNPPHFLIFDALETKFDLRKAIAQVAAQLPESHIFLITPMDRREEFVGFLESGIYDFIYTPLVSPIALLKALDRAAERDYFMYLNERLSDTLKARDAAPPAMAVSDHVGFAREMFEAKSSDEALQVFLRSAATALDNCGTVYFKYVANRRMLLANASTGVDHIDLGGLGLNLNEEGLEFKSAQLRDPMSISEFCKMIHEVFETSDFFAYPVEALGEVQGLIVFLHPEPPVHLSQNLSDWLTLLNKALGGIECERRLHVTAVKDPITELLNRVNFLKCIEQEISRARRTSLPVSLILISVDPFDRIVKELGPEEANTILRVLARILEKHSRVNDLIGRSGPGEFALLLPSTVRSGALIKAERLRRLFASADFSKVLNSFPKITISLGVSEYPSVVRDAEELYQTTDEALFSVRKIGNKTSVAQAPVGFEPDFPVVEKVTP